MLNPKSLENIEPHQFQSKDGATDLVHLSAKVPKSQKEFLAELPGGISINIRKAIAAYQETVSVDD